MHACVYGNQPRMVEFLLMFGKDNVDFDIDAYGCSNRTPLHYAAFEGKFLKIVIWISLGISKSIIISFQFNLILYLGHTECASILLNNGAGFSYLDSLNENPFHKCAANGHAECLALLLSVNNGYNRNRIINQQNVLGSTPLHRVSQMK